MQITKKSMTNGVTRTMDLDVTQEQMAECLSGRKSIEEAFPQLTKAQQEFIFTWMTQEEDDYSEFDELDDEGIATDLILQICSLRDQVAALRRVVIVSLGVTLGVFFSMLFVVSGLAKAVAE